MSNLWGYIRVIDAKTLQTLLLSLFLIAAAFFVSRASAGEPDWGQVPAKTVKSFYPGVASWDFMTGKDHGTGGNVIKKKVF